MKPYVPNTLSLVCQRYPAISFTIVELFVYTALLLVVGTCFGQYRFFMLVILSMCGWLFPRSVRKRWRDKFGKNNDRITNSNDRN